MNVITGTSGFIASHLAEALPDAVGIDKSESPYTQFVADISNRYFTWSGGEVDTLYHLAAEPLSLYEGNWLTASNRAFMVNVDGTFNLIRELKPKRVVFASTANLYGEGRKRTTSSPIKISSPYGYSKFVAEKVLEKSGIPTTILRLGTVAGPRGRTFPNRLVWCAVNGVYVSLFCDGCSLRDIIDVRDVVSAMTANIPPGVYNVSTGSEVRGVQLAELVADEAKRRGYKLNYSLKPGAPKGYVKCSTLFTGKISNHWRPKHSLSDTISTLFDYYESPGAREPPRWDA